MFPMLYLGKGIDLDCSTVSGHSLLVSLFLELFCVLFSPHGLPVSMRKMNLCFNTNRTVM